MSKKILMKGNEAMSEAAIIAGCRYYFGYPITPQNEVPAYFARRLPKVGGTFIQAESEVAAINMVFGAAAAGARVMTSSSSPGISLKQEGISYLAGARLPAVIANVMRGGPGLGGIGGSQADYFQATKGGGHGDYKMIVFAPHTVQELADLTITAFDLADQYRNVVMILGDGYLGQMSEAVELPEPTGKTYEKPWALTGAKGRKSNAVHSIFLNPEDGLEKHNILLQKTYKEIEKNEVRYEEYGAEDADYLMVAFGSGARMCKSAVNKLNEKSIKTRLFRPITLWPFPYKELAEAAKKVKKVLVVEMNAGQMVEDVQLALHEPEKIDFYGRMGGMPLDLDVIMERVKKYEHNDNG